MKCPYCEGDLITIQLENNDGEFEEELRCSSCGGFWVKSMPDDGFAPDSIEKIDRPMPNYSLNVRNLMCPMDGTLLVASEFDAYPTGAKYWRCDDCSGNFYPKGQLALISEHQAKASKPAGIMGMSKAQATSAVMLLIVGSIAFIGSMQAGDGLTFRAAEITTTLTNPAPNFITLMLLGLTYLLGTMTAVLGRRRQMIYLGWAVIIVCLTGFSLIIFSP